MKASGSKMESQSNHLKDHLLELLDPSMSPEKALRLFSHSCFKPDAYTESHIEPQVIFHTYIRYIIKWSSDACVEGIWEKILRKTLEYSRNVSREDITCFRSSFFHDIYTKLFPNNEDPISIWFNRILINQINCPNPYIRLELFRLLRIYQRDWQSEGDAWSTMTWRNLCRTFICTISEIQPHRLYPSGHADDLMFSVTDMELFLRKVQIEKHISINDWDITSSTSISFITHSLQLIGVFATVAKFNHNFEKHITEIIDCFRILNMIVNCTEKLDYNVDMSDVSHEETFNYVVGLPPFRVYIIEALCDLSASIVNSCERNLALPVAYLRDIFVWKLGISNNGCDLPMLLLSRQTDGSSVVHQHLLLLKDLSRERRILDRYDHLEDDNWIYTFCSVHMRDYLEYEDSESESETSGNSGRTSDSDIDSWEESLPSIATGSSEDNEN